MDLNLIGSHRLLHRLQLLDQIHDINFGYRRRVATQVLDRLCELTSGPFAIAPTEVVQGYGSLNQTLKSRFAGLNLGRSPYVFPGFVRFEVLTRIKKILAFAKTLRALHSG